MVIYFHYSCILSCFVVTSRYLSLNSVHEEIADEQ